MRPQLCIVAFSTTLALLLAQVQTSATDGTSHGPSTTTDPYVVPAAPGVSITSLLTVNDTGSATNGYELVGIPDGTGVMKDGHTLVLFMNHELRDTAGIVRWHGQKGTFVSRYEIDRDTYEVTSGSDLIDPGVRYWDYVAGAYVTSTAAWADGAIQNPAFGRFCSATLSEPGALRFGRFGYEGRIFFTNEENGDTGRVLGVLEDGSAQTLPRLGLGSWENNKPATKTGRATVVIGLEDGPRDGSQVWVYVGSKQEDGNAFDRAGLTNGSLFVIDAVNAAVTNDAQWRAAYPKGVAGPVTLSAISWNATGAVMNAAAKAGGLSLDRVEDGDWDPRNPNDLYFLNTTGGDRTTDQPYPRDGGGLWRLSFVDASQPELGATLTLLLDGSEDIAPGEPKLNNPDNMAIDRHGNLLIQEDPGNNAHLARIVAYRIRDGAVATVARFDAQRFVSGGAMFMTQDEESSGILDTSEILGDGTFIFNAQVHTANGLPTGTGPNTVQEYVEHGQLLVLKVTDWGLVYGGDIDED